MIYLPLIVCIIGLIIYAIADQPKPAEIGRLMFWTGLLISLFRWS